MQLKLIKKILARTGIVLFVLFLALAIHIFLVIRPKADAHTRIMARIDVNQPVLQDDVNKITTWLYHQKGVDHVMVNPGTGIVVFTFSPLRANANDISIRFKSELGFRRSERYLPTEKELKGGCPVAATSISYKLYDYFKNIF